MEWSKSNIQVRYQETDQMGVVYHANYFVWFEVGRTEMMKQRGLSYRQLEEKGIMLPVVDVSCKYHVPAKYDDKIVIKARIKEYKGIKLTIEYQVLRETGMDLLATGETKHVWVNRDMKPVRLERFSKEIHESIETMVNE